MAVKHAAVRLAGAQVLAGCDKADSDPRQAGWLTALLTLVPWAGAVPVRGRGLDACSLDGLMAVWFWLIG